MSSLVFIFFYVFSSYLFHIFTLSYFYLTLLFSTPCRPSIASQHPSVAYSNPNHQQQRRRHHSPDGKIHGNSNNLNGSAKARRTDIQLRSPMRNTTTQRPPAPPTRTNNGPYSHEAAAVALMKAYEEDQSRTCSDQRAFSPLLSATTSTVAMRTSATANAPTGSLSPTLAAALDDPAMLQAQIKSLRFYSMGPPRASQLAPSWGGASGSLDSTVSFYPAQDLALATRFSNLWTSIDNMRRLEAEENRPHLLFSSAYLETGVGITVGMRAVLIDWMVDVHARFRLKAPTLHLSVALLDRFLSARAVDVSGIQLIGCAALCVASKYEEIRAPLIRDFAWVTDDFYTKQQIQTMEALILETLCFKVASPTILNYANEVMTVFRSTCQQDAPATLSRRIEPAVFAKLQFALEFVCEAAVQTPQSLNFSRRELGAACLCVALQMLRAEFPHCWNLSLTLYTGMDLDDFAAAEAMIRAEMCLMPTRTMTATRDKFCRAEYMGVGLLVPAADGAVLRITRKAIFDTLTTLGVSVRTFNLVRWLRVSNGRVLEVLSTRPLHATSSNIGSMVGMKPTPDQASVGSGSGSTSTPGSNVAANGNTSTLPTGRRDSRDDGEIQIRWVQSPESVYQLLRGACTGGIALPLPLLPTGKGGKSGGKAKQAAREREREMSGVPVIVVTRWVDREVVESLEGGQFALAQYDNQSLISAEHGKDKEKDKGCMKCTIM